MIDGYYFVIKTKWCKVKGKVIYPYAEMAEIEGNLVAKGLMKSNSLSSIYFAYGELDEPEVKVKPHYRKVRKVPQYTKMYKED